MIEALERIAKVVRRVLGAPDYESYIAHECLSRQRHLIRVPGRHVIR